MSDTVSPIRVVVGDITGPVCGRNGTRGAGLLAACYENSIALPAHPAIEEVRLVCFSEAHASTARKLGAGPGPPRRRPG